jgi:hypothetical protein
VITFSESQNRHNWSHLWPSQCGRFCNTKVGRHKKSQKELAKPDFWSFLKPAALWQLVTVTNGYNYDRHNAVLVFCMVVFLAILNNEKKKNRKIIILVNLSLKRKTVVVVVQKNLERFCKIFAILNFFAILILQHFSVNGIFEIDTRIYT